MIATTSPVSSYVGFASMNDAARFSTLSTRNLRMLVASGRLPSHRVGGRILIAYEDLDAMIRRGVPIPGEASGD